MMRAYGTNYVRKGGHRTQRAAMMTAATKLGITVESYAAHLENDERWCGFHRAWEAKDSFTPIAGNQMTGVASDCRDGASERARQRHARKRAGAVL